MKEKQDKPTRILIPVKDVESMLESLHIGDCSITSHTAKKIGISLNMLNAAQAHGKIERIGRGVIDRSELARWISQTPFAAAKLCEKFQARPTGPISPTSPTNP